MLKLKYWTNSNSHTKCYATKVLFIWFSYSLFLSSSLTSFRSNRFRVKSHQFSAAYLWRVTDYRFTRGHLVIYSLSICYRNLTNFFDNKSNQVVNLVQGVSKGNVSFKVARTNRNMQVRSSKILALLKKILMFQQNLKNDHAPEKFEKWPCSKKFEKRPCSIKK